MNYHDDDGEIVFCDTFSYQCPDCGGTRRVVSGRARRHWCRMPKRFRGKRGEAWADGEQWVLDHPEDYGLRPARSPFEDLKEGRA